MFIVLITILYFLMKILTTDVYQFGYTLEVTSTGVRLKSSVLSDGLMTKGRGGVVVLPGNYVSSNQGGARFPDCLFCDVHMRVAFMRCLFRLFLEVQLLLHPAQVNLIPSCFILTCLFLPLLVANVLSQMWHSQIGLCPESAMLSVPCLLTFNLKKACVALFIYVVTVIAHAYYLVFNC